MAKSNTFSQAILDLVLFSTNIANIGDATGLRGSTTVGSLYWALHTADPGAAGSAITSEAAYTGYGRVTTARSSSALTRTGNNVSPNVNVDFPACTASPGGNITHASLVNTASGAGMILWSGAVSPNLAMSVGAIPRLNQGSTITES